MPVAAPSAEFTADFDDKDDQFIRWLLKLNITDKLDANKYSEKHKIK
jgi:hypothetical protein